MSTGRFQLARDVFLVNELGACERILQGLSRAFRNDLSAIIPIQQDERTKFALKRLYQKLKLPKDSCEKLFSHVTVRMSGQMKPRVLVSNTRYMR